MPLRALPDAAGEEVAGEHLFEAVHGGETLGRKGGGNGNDVEVVAGEDGEQVGEQLRLQLVLAGLTRQNDYKRMTGFGADGIDDGRKNVALVSA